MENKDQLTNLFIRPISPNKFKEGGAAILEDTNKNHHNDKEGKILINPLFKYNLRL